MSPISPSTSGSPGGSPGQLTNSRQTPSKAENLKRSRAMCADGRPLKVRKACERCKAKKVKCDEQSPCTRCKERNVVCTAENRQKIRSKRTSEGYSQSLETTLHALTGTIQKLYTMLRNNEEWVFGEPEMNDEGQPIVQDLVAKLGYLRSLDSISEAKESPENYDEDFREPTTSWKASGSFDLGNRDRKCSIDESTQTSFTEDSNHDMLIGHTFQPGYIGSAAKVSSLPSYMQGFENTEVLQQVAVPLNPQTFDANAGMNWDIDQMISLNTTPRSLKHISEPSSAVSSHFPALHPFNLQIPAQEDIKLQRLRRQQVASSFTGSRSCQADPMTNDQTTTSLWAHGDDCSVAAPMLSLTPQYLSRPNEHMCITVPVPDFSVCG